MYFRTLNIAEYLIFMDQSRNPKFIVLYPGYSGRNWQFQQVKQIKVGKNPLKEPKNKILQKLSSNGKRSEREYEQDDI